jgi:hypothetical protein
MAGNDARPAEGRGGPYALSPATIEAIKSSLRSSLDEVQRARHDFPPVHDFQRALTEIEGRGTSPAYDREVLVEVLVYHQRKDASRCACGWAELGRSHAEHVATVYEESMEARHA